MTTTGRPGRLERLALAGVSRAAGALPPGLGQSALARRYVRLGRWPGDSVRERSFRGRARFALDLSDRTQAEAYLVGGYELELVRYAVEQLPADAVVFDVGANVGLHTFQLLARRPDLTVYAFEPNVRNVAAWRRNRALNPAGRAVLAEVAVGATPGRARLDVPSDSGSGFITPGSGDTEVVTLDAVAAQWHVERIDLLKLDIEGHEFQALQGARGLFEDGRVARIVCEFNEAHLERAGLRPHDVRAWLEERGFVQGRLPSVGVRRLRGVVAADAVFERRQGDE